MGKQMGPLPLGAWVAIVGGSLAFMMYQRNRNASPADAVTSLDALSADSIGGVGVGGVGAIGGYTPTDGGTGAPSDASGAIESNTQWGQKVFAFLTGQGNDPATVDKAVRDYLSGIGLNVQANGLITQGLGKFGMPPETIGNAPPLPVAPKPAPTTPKPVPVRTVVRPKPPAPAPKPPVGRTYVVAHGDTLSGIASRFWQPWITWRSIFNANRGVIGGNPNRIQAGQKLVIG